MPAVGARTGNSHASEPAVAHLPPATLWRLGAIAMVLVGACLRLFALPLVPGFHFDEAANAFDIDGILKGVRPIFFEANRGREPLFIYAQAVGVYLTGATPFALRLTAVGFGIAGIAGVHFAARQLVLATGLSRHADSVACLAAAGFAGGYWPLSLSLVGLRAISLIIFACLAVGFLWRGVRTDRTADYALAGAVTGIAMYTYLASRALPLLLALALVGHLLIRPTRRVLGQIAIGVGAFALVFAPLASYFVTHAADAAGRADEVSILNPAHSGGDPVRAVMRALWRNAPAFSPIWGDRPAGAFGGTPSVDPVQIVLVWVGAVVVGVVGLRALRRRAWDSLLPLAFVLVWLLAFLAPSFLSVHVLHQMRAVGAQPPLALLAAIGLAATATGVGRLTPVLRGHRRWVAPLLLAGASTILSTSLYLQWLRGDSAYYEYMTEKVESARLIGEWARDSSVFVAPLYFQDYTVRYVARDVWRDVRTFDPAAAAVVPADRPALYVFPAIDDTQPQEMVTRLAGLGQLTVRSGANGRPLLRVVTVRPGVAETPALATIGTAVDLVTAAAAVTGAPPNRTVNVRLVWRARAAVPGNFTVFVHIRDQSGQTIAQKDGPPGGGTLPTTGWRVGDTVVDDYRIVVPGSAVGAHRVVVGMYVLSTLQRVELRVGDHRAAGDELEVGSVELTP